MVGRERELELLDETLWSVAQGANQAVAVVGELGIGKTRLVQEAVRRAADLGYLVLKGTAAEPEQQVPFALIVDVLDPHLRTLDSERLARLGGDRRAELAAIFSSLRGKAGGPSFGTQAERYRLHLAVRALIEELASEQPLMLAFDDLQWADDASNELLAYVLRRALQQPVLLLLAFRPRYTPRLLTDAVKTAEREGRLRSIELGPLTRSEAEALLGADLESDKKRLVYDESGGNPLFLEQLRRSPIDASVDRRLRDQGPASNGEWPVPLAVRASIAEELATLSSTARTLLQAAAVAGEPFEIDLAIQIGSLGEGEGLEALDELQGRDLVRATDAPRRFTFRHPVVRRAVYESTGDGWRLAAHERAGQALAAQNVPPALQAYHVERSARIGDEAALAVLTEAASTAAPRAPAIAARWYGAALDIMGDAGNTTQRSELLVLLARSLAAAGRPAESGAALTEALELLPPDASGAKTSVIGLLAQTEAFLGHAGQARTLLMDALESCRKGSPEHLSLTLELAVDHLRTHDREGAARWATDTLAGARSCGDPALHGSAAALLGVIEHHRGDVAAMRALVEEAEGVVDRVSNREVAVRLTALYYLSLAEAGLAQHAAAIRYGERGVAVCRATGQTYLFAPLKTVLAIAKMGLGRLDEAAAEADAAFEVAQLLEIDQYIEWSAALRSWVASQRGDVTTAVAAGELAVEASHRGGPGIFDYWPHCVLGEAYLLANEAEKAKQEILQNLGGPDLPMVGACVRGRWYEVLASAELALDRPQAAAAWVDRAAAAVARAPLAEREAGVQRARAGLLLACDEPSEAVPLALEAAATFDSHRLPIEASRARTLAGRALARIGDSTRAIAELQRAVQTLDACGARGARDEAATELRQLGHRVPGPRRGPAAESKEALTPREYQIARLVAAGRTNGEIAGQLFLSERTVERQLSHIFTKLGVSSRVQVAHQIARAEPDA